MKTQLFVLLAAASFIACRKPMAELNEKELSPQRQERIIKDGSVDVHGLLGQSPIDIPMAGTVKFFSNDPVFHYEPFTLDEVKHTGDNLKVYVHGNNYITINGIRYDLKQFHFHRSSEHGFQGKKAPLEVHLVHVANGGAIAVVGVLYQKGGTNASLQPILDGSPDKVGVKDLSPAQFHPASLLPVTSTPYVTYSGSLTTSPFTDNLTWIVYKQAKQVSTAQIDQYYGIYTKDDTRAFQPIGSRKIYERVGN
jgi:carbonic anhydrase